MNISESYYNFEAWNKATVKTIVDLEPDMHSAQAGGPGKALEILNPKLYKWPGASLGPNVMHQYLEGEPLKASEYDTFLSDPGDFTLRSYLPRVWVGLESLTKLPALRSLWGAGVMASRSTPFSSPDVIKAFKDLAKAGEEQAKFMQSVIDLDEDLTKAGFPNAFQGMSPAPFDVVSDHLRGMTGTMMDMYRHPEELKKTCELILNDAIASGMMALNNKRGNPKKVVSALHRGSDGFMSLKQFENFYWPTLKKMIIATTDKGLIHVPFYEGNWEQRLQYLLELPKARTIARFALTDMAKAKDVLKGHSCIMGGVPHTMLQISSPTEVEEYVKNLIKTCGKDGGLIISTSTALTHEAKPENVKAMVDTVKKYGRY